MGLVLEIEGRADLAAAYYRKAAELEPANQQYALRAAAAAGADDGSVDAAAHRESASNDREQAATSPAQLAVEDGLVEAEAAFERGDVQRARDLLTKVVSLEPNTPQVPIRAAVLALRHRQPQLAVFVLQPLEKQFSDSAPFFRTLGTAYYRQADYRRAQSALQQALSLDNSNALAYVLMGCTLEKLGQNEAAATHLEQAARLDPRLCAQP
jgi:tetratricopeptide (TPR) repeat protein